ncbi:MAG: secretin N-terminal domain-containing protein [Fimbriimonadaceae bacterium]
MKSQVIVRTVSLLVLGMAVVSANAQFDFGGGSSGPAKKAWAEFKLPKKTMKLDFRNANIDMILAMFTKESGITIVKDPTLTAPFTLTTAKAVSLADAFEVLEASLSVRNYELKKEGSLMTIKAKPAQNRGRNTQFQMPQVDMTSLFGGGQSPATSLEVYPVQFAAASQVARVLNDVFQPQANSNNPLASFFQSMGRGPGGRGGFGGAGGGATQAALRASYDDFSNTVIVNGTKDQHKQVGELIKHIDKQTDAPVKPVIYKLDYADATTVATTVQNLLVANQPKGRGTAQSSSGGQNIDTRFSFFGGGGGGQNNQARQQAQAAVTADVRSNSLVVTTTDENHKLVSGVIKELDKEVKVQSTTFVFPLDNARADSVATLLQNAFGRRSGAGNTGAGRTNTGTNTGRTNTGRTNTGNRGAIGGATLGGGGNVEVQNDNLDLAVDADGNLETMVAVQGGGFFGGFGQQGGGQGQQNQQNRQTTGRDAQGRLVPTQDLTGQITVIPDPNTNSLIVVTSPENAELVRSILAQIDRIPEQVMIETIIVEASLDSSDKLGVEWNFTQDKAFGNTGTTGTIGSALGLQSSNPQGFRYSLTGGALTAFMNALKTDTKFQVLSTPRIFTSNNVQAEINISQRVPYITSTRTDTNGAVTYTYDFEDVGIVLTVTPRITANGYVTMDVSQTANDLQGFTSFNAPIINQRQADTTVAVKDGETIILGGIIRNTVSTTVKKIPLLGDIPILGQLFKSTDKTSQKTELLVFLTPRVVRNPDDASKLRIDEQKKLSQKSQEELNKAIGGGGEKKSEVKPLPGGGGGK